MPKFIIDVITRGSQKSEKNINSLSGSLKRIVPTALAVGVAMETMRKAVVRSSEVEGVKRGFDNLARSSGFSADAFNKFKKATDGTIDNLTLMTKANNAMLLGISDSEDQMAEMFDVAQRLGQSLGIDTVQSIDSLVTGLGRQSKLMLDNLGIMVDTDDANKNYADSVNKAVSELTEQERKTAFTNEAMRQAKGLVKDLGEEQLTTKDSIAQLNTALLETLTALGDLLTPIIVPFIETLGDYAKAWTEVINTISNADHQFTGVATSLDGFKLLLQANADDTEWLANKTSELSTEEARLNSELAGLTSTGQSAIDFTKAFGMSIDLSGQSTQAWNENMQISEEEFGNIMTLMEEGKFNLDEYITSQEGSTLATINDNTARAEAIQFQIDEVNRKKALIIALGLEKKARGELTKKEQDHVEKMIEGSNTVLGEIRKQIKAKFAQAMAGFIAKEVGTKGFLGLALAPIGAAALSELFDKLVPKAESGANFITSGPQMLMVGDNPSGEELVEVTPLNGDPSPNAPQGRSVVINVSGNVMSDRFVETELAEKIRDGVRRGVDFGF